MTANTKLWEQAAFNDLVHRGGTLPDTDQPQLFRWVQPPCMHPSASSKKAAAADGEEKFVSCYRA